MVGLQRRKVDRRGIRLGPAFSQTDRCPVCGLTYGQFRTGATFAEMSSELWVDSPDRADWRRRTRHTVLGRWHQYKMSLWDRHLACCTFYAQNRAISPLF